MDRSQATWTAEVWIDAQLPPALARWLRSEHGVQAVHVEELGLLRARDVEIFARARAAERPIVLLTKDDDFPKLLTRSGPPPQVGWLRCGNLANSELRKVVLEVWPKIVALFASGEALVEIRRREEASR